MKPPVRLTVRYRRPGASRVSDLQNENADLQNAHREGAGRGDFAAGYRAQRPHRVTPEKLLPGNAFAISPWLSPGRHCSRAASLTHLRRNIRGNHAWRAEAQG